MPPRVPTFLTAFALFFWGPLPAVSAATPIPTPTELQRQIDRLEARVDAAQEARDRQADSLNSSMTVITIVLAAAALIITIVAVGVTVVGYRSVKQYVENQMTERVTKAVDDVGAHVFSTKAEELYASTDGRLTDLFERYERGAKGIET